MEKHAIIHQRKSRTKSLMKTTIGLRVDKYYVKRNGTSRLFLLVAIGSEHAEIPLHLDWEATLVDEVGNKLKPREKGDKLCADYNLIIKDDLSRANNIFVENRLAHREFTLEDFIKVFTDPENAKDFPTFMRNKINDRWSRGKISEGTMKSHVNSYKWLIGFKPKLSFSDISPTFLEKYEDWLYQQNNKRSAVKKKLDVNTIANILKYVSAYFEIAIKSNLCTMDNPFKNSDVKVSQDEREIEHLRPEKVAALIDYYHNVDLPVGKKLTLCRFLIACHLSLRISDILKLTREKVEHYDYMRKLIFEPVKQRKSKKKKIVFVPINDNTLGYLTDLIRLQEHARREGKKISEELGRKLLKEIGKDHDMKISGFHTGRHSFATNYIRAGGIVTNLQQIMGHTNINTTMKYVHIVEEDKDDEMTQLSSFYETRRESLKSSDPLRYVAKQRLENVKLILKSLRDTKAITQEQYKLLSISCLSQPLHN